MHSNKNAMLVRLSISQWYNKAADKKVANEINKAYEVEGSSSSGDLYIKQLLPKEAMASVNKTIGRIRTTHYQMTMPWLDGGLRILPTKMYFEYVERMRHLQDEFEGHVHDFVVKYNAYKAKAKEEKKGLFNESDYPSESDLRRLFEIHTGFYPMPEVEDFRLDIEEETLASIRKSASSEFERAISTASAFLRDKFLGLVEHYYNATKSKKKFHESTVINLYEFANMLPSLNIGNDPTLTRWSEYVVNNLCPHSADAIRNNEELRNNVSELSKRLLDELKAAAQGPTGV